MQTGLIRPLDIRLNSALNYTFSLSGSYFNIDTASPTITIGTVSTPANKLPPNPQQGLVPLPFDNQLEAHPPIAQNQHQSASANKGKTQSNNFVYGAWSEWTACRSSTLNCTGDGTTTRQRACFIYLDDMVSYKL